MTDKRSGDEYGTPRWFYDMLDGRFRFGLDPCTTPDNPLETEKFITKAEDGLEQSWAWWGAGKPVFMNPPYSRGQIQKWVEKAAVESNNGVLVVGLVRHDPSTRWWQKYVQGRALIWPVPYRIRFVGADGAYPFPSAVVVWHGFPSEKIVV